MLDVVLVPGLTASTWTLGSLRHRLESEGFACHWPGFDVQTAIYGELDLLARTVRELGSCALVGHSWGGLQAVTLALADNPHVCGVIGLGTPLLGKVQPRCFYAEARSVMGRCLPLWGATEVRYFNVCHSYLPFSRSVQEFVVEKLRAIRDSASSH